MRILTERDVERCLGVDDALSMVRSALVEQSHGRAVVPLRAEVRSPERGLLGLFMPAHLPGMNALGQKTVAEARGNRARGLPVLTAFLTLQDEDTGLLRAVLGATHLTNVRTGALAAVAASLLAPAARTAAVIGTGGLAPATVAALAATLDLDDVRVWGRRADQAERVVDAVGDGGLADGVRVSAVPEARAAVEGADVVVTITSAHEPVLDASWVGDDALVCAMGSNAPHMRELPRELLARARVVLADTYAGVIDRAGEIVDAVGSGVLDPADVAELGDVLTGRSTPATGRGPAVFKSCGFAALDVAIGMEVLRRAEADDVGTVADLGQVT